MVIKIINPKLKTKVFKRIDYYDKLALKYYKIGDMKKGKKYEKKSDQIYKDNYNKIFSKS